MTAPTTPRQDQARAREAERQQWMLATLWRRERDVGPSAWLRGDQATQQSGLAAYRGNAAAVAERALAAAYPTVRMLLGDESFAMLARAHWHAHPPTRGDLAWWGDALPGFIAADPQLADEPYLADVARVDWAVHRAESATEADPAPGPHGDAVAPSLPPGCALIDSPWPVASLWRAHHRAAAGEDGDRFAAVRQAMTEGRGEHALVWRDAGVGQVMAIDDHDAAAMRQLLSSQPGHRAAARAAELSPPADTSRS